MGNTNKIGNWFLDRELNVSVGDFNNVTAKHGTKAFPGKRGDAAATFHDGALDPVNSNSKQDFSYIYKDDADLQRIRSAMAECINRKAYSFDEFKSITFAEGDYLYFYKGNNYFYGIKKDYSEFIASVGSNGDIIPVVAGAGSFYFLDADKNVRLNVKQVKSFVESEKNGHKTLKVYYDCDADCRYLKEISTTYTFNKGCINAEACVEAESFEPELFKEYCFFMRQPLNPCDRYQKRTAYYWKYPEDNDYVYKEADALVLSEDFGDSAVYTFIRDENSAHQFELCNLTRHFLPLQITEKWPMFRSSVPTTDSVAYKFNMDIAFVENNETAAYYALFSSKKSDFAAGICAVDNDDNAAFFTGKDVTLNLNVTNISDKEIKYSVRYNIFNHYNEIVSSGIFYNNVLGVGEEANRNLELHLDNYGMYYLNFYVSSDSYEHREAYQFAMIEDVELSHRSESPFGLCAPYTNCYEEQEAAVKLLGKLGISSMRMDKQNKNFQLSDRLKDVGITRQSISIPYNKTPDDVEGYMERVKELARDWLDRVEIFFMANEFDMQAKGNYSKSQKGIEERFLPYTFNPAYEFFTKEYPDKLKKIIWESNCHGTIEWFEAFYEAGLWDKSEIIDIHTYSNPTGPDKVFTNTVENKFSSMYSNEYAMQRFKRICRRYGKKRFIVGETGYPTSARTKVGMDHRTVADFNVRIALFLLEAGAEIINYFGTFDRVSLFVGSSTWRELYFGAFTNTDYYGTYMPKAWAAAYANLIRRFDGFENCEFIDKYDEDEFGTLRAFNVNLKNGTNFAVAWSNIYMQPNTTAIGGVKRTGREPRPNWENRWVETETRTFDATADEVKVVDVMGNAKMYKAKNGKVDIEISGSPVFIYGIC